MSTTEHVSAISATVGAWSVDVSLLSGVTAQRNGSSEVHSTSLIYFPVGWRVGQHWTNGNGTTTPEIPEAVKKKARALAKRLHPLG